MKLQAEMNIAHLNTRREKEGEDEGPIAFDLKLSASLAIDALKDLFTSDRGYMALLESIYTDEGDLITHDLESMQLAIDAVGVSVLITHGLKTKLEFDMADVDKIRIKPQPGKFADLTLRLQIKPNKLQMSALVEMLHEDIGITIASKQHELPLAGTEAPPAAA